MRRFLCSSAVSFALLASASAADFTGRWESDFGVVELAQRSEFVSGTYSCCGGGTIEGRASGDRLQFTWEDAVNGGGWGNFVLSADGDHLDGVWGYGGQEKANGSWRATRFQAATMRGIPSYWTVSGVNALIGSLSGTAELFTQGDKVSGKIEGQYSGAVPGQSFDVFNYIEGTASKEEMRLRWRNPMDGSTGRMTLRRSGDRLAGFWQSDDGKSRGSISLAQVADNENMESSDSVLDNQAKRHRAEQLLHSAAESDSSEEAVRKYQEAERLFRELGDMNKVGYALYGQGSDELNRGHYDEAQQLYKQVLGLGDTVDATIRELAQTGLSIVAIAREVDQGRKPGR